MSQAGAPQVAAVASLAEKGMAKEKKEKRSAEQAAAPKTPFKWQPAEKRKRGKEPDRGSEEAAATQSPEPGSQPREGKGRRKGGGWQMRLPPLR